MSKRTRAIALAVAFGVTFVVLYGLLVTVWGVPNVRLVNDLDHDVGLRNCKDWRRLETGGTMQLRPNGPCSVYELDGDLESYIGCLAFSSDAFESQEDVNVSQYDVTVSQRDCAHGESYDHYAPASTAIDRVVDWLTP